MKKNKSKISEKLIKPLGELRLDPVIEIIKGMHCEPQRERFYDIPSIIDRDKVIWGMTKEETCEELGISLRTFQNILNRLDRKKNKEEPFYICGQPIKLDITEERVSYKKLKKALSKNRVDLKNEIISVNEDIKDRRTRYCTPNSMHPVFLQLNVSQLACLMKALAHFDEINDGNIASGLGVYVLSQLSRYGISRLEKIYAENDAVLKNFLDNLQDYSEEQIQSAFMTDEEFHEFIDCKINEMLLLCCKLEKPCNIVLKINGNTKEYKNVRVVYGADGYIMQRDGENPICFTEENIRDIDIIQSK